MMLNTMGVNNNKCSEYSPMARVTPGKQMYNYHHILSSKHAVVFTDILSSSQHPPHPDMLASC